MYIKGFGICNLPNADAASVAHTKIQAFQNIFQTTLNGSTSLQHRKQKTGNKLPTNCEYHFTMIS